METEITYIDIKDVPTRRRKKWAFLVEGLAEGKAAVIPFGNLEKTLRAQMAFLGASRTAGMKVRTRIKPEGKQWILYVWRRENEVH